MLGSMRRSHVAGGLVGAVVLGLQLQCAVGAEPPPPAAARAWLATVEPAADLQAFLERTLVELAGRDTKLRTTDVRVALLDLTRGEPPRLAQVRGEGPIYPASVVKLVYLMAAYAWQEAGRLTIDSALDADLTAMIRQSSNHATQRVFARLTDTEPGPELPADAYRLFRERRLAVKRWLESLGITDLHCVNPTYDGGGDLFGRDRQFLRDATVPGAPRRPNGEYPNRQAMTAVGTAKLLGLLATDRALTPQDSAIVRARMRRDPAEQPYLVHRIAGGARRLPGVEVFAKSGTWGPDYADAGIVRDARGRQFVLVVFTEASPPYRGSVIAEIAWRAGVHLFTSPTAAGERVAPGSG